jgi:hypothetical protein
MINSQYLKSRKEACSHVKRQIGRSDPVERASCAEQAVIRAASPASSLLQDYSTAGASACGFIFPIPQVKVACVFV